MSDFVDKRYLDEAKAEVDALRARVRTLEGAPMLIRGHLPGCTRAVADATTHARLGDTPCTCALLGAQPDTALAEMEELRAKLAEAQAREKKWLDGMAEAELKDTAAAQLALAEREASIVELRRALEKIAGGSGQDFGECSCRDVHDEGSATCARTIARAALAQPAPQAALRAFGLRLIDVMHRRILNDEPIDGAREAIVDAVLKGES